MIPQSVAYASDVFESRDFFSFNCYFFTKHFFRTDPVAEWFVEQAVNDELLFGFAVFGHEQDFVIAAFVVAVSPDGYDVFFHVVA